MKTQTQNLATFGLLTNEHASSVTGVLAWAFLVIVAGAFLEPAYTQDLNSDSAGVLKKALLLTDKKPHEALKVLQSDQLKADLKYYQISVEEIIKLYYQAENWPRFFAYVQFYRKAFSKKQNPKIQVLELLALLRHCRADLLGAMISYYKKHSPPLSYALDQIEALSKTRFKGKKANQESESKIALHLSGESLWKIDHKLFKNKDPSKLKVYVENKC